jgi:molybdenum cofactor cytidylyltransferase
LHDPAAILLAAGRASRFGSDKLLAPVVRAGVQRPLLVHSLLSWLQVFGRVHVVVRPDHEGLLQAVESALPQHARTIDWVVCEDADRGMGVSLAAGVAATAEAGGWLIGLADMPAVPSTVISEVCHALQSGAGLVAPYFGAQRGHPVGINVPYRDELLRLDGDRGARDLLLREQSSIKHIQTEDIGVLQDIDTPSDLLSLSISMKESP